jgi:hypothetical protein
VTISKDDVRRRALSALPELRAWHPDALPYATPVAGAPGAVVPGPTDGELFAIHDSAVGAARPPKQPGESGKMEKFVGQLVLIGLIIALRACIG